MCVYKANLSRLSRHHRGWRRAAAEVSPTLWTVECTAFWAHHRAEGTPGQDGKSVSAAKESRRNNRGGRRRIECHFDRWRRARTNNGRHTQGLVDGWCVVFQLIEDDCPTACDMPQPSPDPTDCCRSCSAGKASRAQGSEERWVRRRGRGRRSPSTPSSSSRSSSSWRKSTQSSSSVSYVAFAATGIEQQWAAIVHWIRFEMTLVVLNDAHLDAILTPG